MTTNSTPKLEKFVQSYADKAGLLRLNPHRGAKRIYYLSGAVSGDPYAVLKFRLAVLFVSRNGDYPINPLDYSPNGVSWEEALANDLGILNRLCSFYVSAISTMNLFPTANIPLPCLLLIDPEKRPIESRGVKLEKAIALANGIPINQINPEFETILNNAIKEISNNGKRKG